MTDQTTRLDTAFVAGATGATGRALTELLAPRVETLVTLTRDSANGESLHALGADEVFVDDLLDPDGLEMALAGVDAVFSTVGTAATQVHAGGPYVDGEGNRTLVAAAEAADVDTVVLESALGVGDEPASPLAAVFEAAIGPVQAAKADAEAALRDADVRHTILRPGVLTGSPRTDDVTVADPGAKLWGTVSRADVARLLAAAATTPAAADRTFEVVSTPSFPDRAVDVDWRLPRRPDGTDVPVQVV